MELEGRNCREGAGGSEEAGDWEGRMVGRCGARGGAGEGESGDGEGCMGVDEDVQDARRRAGVALSPDRLHDPELPTSDEADFRHNELGEPGCMRSVRLENAAIRRTGPAGEEVWERRFAGNAHCVYLASRWLGGTGRRWRRQSRGGAECRRRALGACGIVGGGIGERASWSGVSAQAVVA